MVRLYIADTDPGFIRCARKALARCRAVEVLGDTGDGRRALEDLKRLKPDALLTDIQLPGLDGLALLKETRRFAKPPAVIVCTRFYPTACMDWCFRYGASYFLCKPIDFDRLPELILDCAAQAAVPVEKEEESDDGHARAVREKLTELGVSPKLNGCAYLIESVLRARENGLLLRNLSHGLYSELAACMGTTVSRVERSLRSAIAAAYERGALRERFAAKPTNRQFIEFLLRETE